MEATSSDKLPIEQNLVVALRIRPINQDEIHQQASTIAHRVDKNMVVLMDPAEDPDDVLRANRSREKQYMFDIAFDGQSSQENVYQNTCKFLIPSVINGFNATVFAYGATGAGKTHTMLGRADDPGIMARALNELFALMEKTKEDMTYEVTMSYLEIYNEMIRDLLCPSSGYLDLREDSKGVHVAGLSEVPASSTAEVMRMLTKGNKERTQEPTAANKTSSRSHAVLMVSVRQRARLRNIMQEVRLGRLFLIDLAGSERAANTHNTGKRMVEGAHINRSLLALGNCINALSEKNRSNYINYRDSKLTRLLKDSLGGNTKTVMIAHISPASVHFEESRNTLVYADRAKNIRTKVRKNVTEFSTHLSQYTNLIQSLRNEILRLHEKLDNKESATTDQESAQENGSSSTSLNVVDPSAAPVASEAFVSSSAAGSAAFNSIKEDLTKMFEHQMELRNSLLDVKNMAMEITAEITKNQLMIKNYEREKVLATIRPEEEDKIQDDERIKEGEGPEMVTAEEAEKAHQDISDLVVEGRRIEELKQTLIGQLEEHLAKSNSIEDLVPERVTRAEQEELLRCMRRLHEAEIDNLELRAANLLRKYEHRQAATLVRSYRAQRRLADELITAQRRLLDEACVEVPDAVEQIRALYYRWQDDVDEMFPPALLLALHRDPNSVQENTGVKSSSVSTIGGSKVADPDNLSDADKLSAVDEESTVVANPNIRATARSRAADAAVQRAQNQLKANDSESAVFLQSPRARLLQRDTENAAARQTQRDTSQSYPATITTSDHAPSDAISTHARQRSVITLSTGSRTASPDNTSVVKETVAQQRGTRGIAALAAQRKARADTHNSTDKMSHASKKHNFDKKNNNVANKYGSSSKNVSNDEIKEFRPAETPPTTVVQKGPERGRGLTVQKRVIGKTVNRSLSKTKAKSMINNNSAVSNSSKLASQTIKKAVSSKDNKMINLRRSSQGRIHHSASGNSTKLNKIKVKPAKNQSISFEREKNNLMTIRKEDTRLVKKCIESRNKLNSNKKIHKINPTCSKFAISSDTAIASNIKKTPKTVNIGAYKSPTIGTSQSESSKTVEGVIDSSNIKEMPTTEKIGAHETPFLGTSQSVSSETDKEVIDCLSDVKSDNSGKALSEKKESHSVGIFARFFRSFRKKQGTSTESLSQESASVSCQSLPNVA